MVGRRVFNLTTTTPFLQSSLRYSSTFNFYQNRQLEQYANREAKPLTLRQLVFFGRHLTEEKILKSANYVRSELPVRIAHRLRDLQALPYVVVTQEGVEKVYKLYWTAFEKFRTYPPITSIEENTKFCKFVGSLLDDHAVVIPNLSLGLSLSSPFLSPDKLDSFMRRMLVSRISRRVLAEHHIALSKTYLAKDSPAHEAEPRVGIIYTALDVKRCIDRCSTILRDRPLWVHGNEDVRIDAWPEVEVEGHLDTKFAYIRDHLEYIVFELLKNAMSATVLKHHDSGSSLPPIRVTIVAGEDDISLRISDQGGGLTSVNAPTNDPMDLFSFSHIRNASRLEDSRLGALRTASEEGLRATVDEQLSRWQKHSYYQPKNRDKLEEHGTAPSQEIMNIVRSRIGIGLPMSNIYATYFGGSLELVSLDGWGTDVFLRLPKLGTNLEGIEV
ncbi:atypical/PDHK/BCKDK protein kinase [Coprinopsis cinerea AmutBmut pab1-1]|nr:atypical/PDHK/BCKDK protein kinase [Coprinopsis cinerea AmutBmut pab1-1]